MKKRRYKEKRPLGAMADRQSELEPSFTRILHKHGLCLADMPVCAAFELFLRVERDPIVKAMRPRTTVPRTNLLGIYAGTSAALERMTCVQKQALLARLNGSFESKKEYR